MLAHTPVALRDSLSARRTTRAMTRITIVDSRADDEFGLTKRKFARELDDVADDRSAAPAPAESELVARHARKLPKAAACGRIETLLDALLGLNTRLGWAAMGPKWKYAQPRWLRRVEAVAFAARADPARIDVAEIGEALLELESNVARDTLRDGWAASRNAWHGEVAAAVELESTARLDSAVRALRYGLAPALEAAPAAGDAAHAYAGADETAWFALQARAREGLASGHANAHSPVATRHLFGAQPSADGFGACELSPASTEPATRSPESLDVTFGARLPRNARAGAEYDEIDSDAIATDGGHGRARFAPAERRSRLTERLSLDSDMGFQQMDLDGDDDAMPPTLPHAAADLAMQPTTPPPRNAHKRLAAWRSCR
jgi:hypothetical protein